MYAIWLDYYKLAYFASLKVPRETWIVNYPVGVDAYAWNSTILEDYQLQSVTVSSRQVSKRGTSDVCMRVFICCTFSDGTRYFVGKFFTLEITRVW